MAGAGSIFIELAIDQRLDLLERPIAVRPFTRNLELRAVPRRQHHEAHDALAVDAFAILFDPHVATKAAADFYEHGGGARMEAEAVLDGQFLAEFLRRFIVAFSAEKTH